jgi:hypothetical protein
MSAPESHIQSKVKITHQNTLKLKEGWKMIAAMKIRKVQTVLSRSPATQHPVKLAAILALGTILLAGTGLHVMSNSTAESGSVPLAKDQQRVEESTQERPAVQRVQENVVSTVPSREIFVIGEYDDNLVFDGTQWKVDDSEHALSKSPVPSYDRQRVEDSIQERLEVQQILEDMRDYKESTSLSRTPRGPKIIPDDEWRFDSPHYDDFLGESDRPGGSLNQP